MISDHSSVDAYLPTLRNLMVSKMRNDVPKASVYTSTRRLDICIFCPTCVQEVGDHHNVVLQDGKCTEGKLHKLRVFKRAPPQPDSGRHGDIPLVWVISPDLLGPFTCMMTHCTSSARLSPTVNTKVSIDLSVPTQCCGSPHKQNDNPAEVRQAASAADVADL